MRTRLLGASLWPRAPPTVHATCPVHPIPTVSIAHRHPTMSLDEQRRRGQDGTGRDIKHRPSVASEARPHGPGATTLTTWTSAGPSQRSTTPDSPSTGSDESSPPAQVHNLDERAVVRCHGHWAPEPAARPPLAVGPAAPRGLHASTPSLGQPGTNWRRTGTTLHDSMGWASASSGSEAVVWAGWGSPRGVSTFEKVSLAFGAARLRSSLATLWLRG